MDAHDSPAPARAAAITADDGDDVARRPGAGLDGPRARVRCKELKPAPPGPIGHDATAPDRVRSDSLGTEAWALGAADDRAAGCERARDAAAGGLAAAFTLVEVLVSIAVVAVLVGLALVGIGHLRETAAQSRDLSNLKSHVAAMAVYGTSNKEAFPHFIRADGTSQLANLPAGATYFTQSIYWPILFSDRSAAWVSPGEFFPRVPQYDHDPPDPLAFPYLYTATAVAHPDYWSQETRTGQGQFVTVRFSDCRFPSQKVLLSNTSVRVPDRAWAGFVDGSAAGYLRTEFTEPMPTGEGPGPVRWSSQAGWPVGSHTLNGMHGRDVLKR